MTSVYTAIIVESPFCRRAGDINKFKMTAITWDPYVAIVGGSPFSSVRLGLKHEMIIRWHGLHEWIFVYKHFQTEREVRRVAKPAWKLNVVETSPGKSPPQI